MQRDQRITGAFRAQSDQVKAPAGFEVTNPWHVSGWLSGKSKSCADLLPGGTEDIIGMRNVIALVSIDF